MSRGGQEPPLVWTVGCSGIKDDIRERGLEVRSWRSIDAMLHAEHGVNRLRTVVLHDESLGNRTLPSTVRAIRSRFPLVDVLLWAPGARAPRVREALQGGIHDVILGRSSSRLADMVAQTVDLQRFLPRLLRTRYDGTKTRFEGMLSRSRRMWDIFDTCERVARTDATVLVLGETGTGKELIARAIHRRSQRSGRFVAVNCGAIPRDLIDSELFGHEKGAFTGAAHAKPGLFRHADGGTLFLDEIGNISEGAQASLLRVLQEGALRPVGGHDEIPVDVRVVAATSTPLEADVKAKRFREDLFYRLDVIRLVLPALRERPEDILFLFASFASRAAKQYRVERPDVNDSFLEELTSYAWPGNVRELDNFTERLILTKTPGEVLNARHFRRLMRQPDPDSHKHKEGKTRPLADLERPRTPAIEPYLDLGKPLEEALQPHLESLERAYLEACLKQNHGRIARTAEQAGISRRTLLRRLNHYGIEKSEFKESS